MTSTDDMFNSFDLLPNNIVIADAKGIIQFVNHHGLKQSGYPQTEIIGSPLSKFWDQPEKASKDILSQLKKQNIWQGEIKQLCKDGSSHWEMTSLSFAFFKDTNKNFIIQSGQQLNAEKQTRINALEKECHILKEKAELYRTILDASPDPISLTRVEDGKYLDVNAAFHKRTGFTPEQIAKHTAVELNVYSDQSQRDRLINRLKKDGPVENLEVSITTPKGNIVNDLWSLRIVTYKEEDHLLLIARNYSQLRAAQQALKESEKSYRRILEAVPYSIVVTRLSDAHYMQVNEAFCRRTGYSREDALGHTPHELGIFMNPVAQKRLRKTFDEDGRVHNMEVQFQAKDGTILENLLSATPITYKGEACILTITVAIDELKAAQRALKESEERYRNILKNMEEGYWEMDLKGRFIFVNEAECRIHQRTKQEMIGKSSKNFTYPETAKKIISLFNRVYKTGTPASTYDVELIRPDETVTVIESSASLLKDAEGKAIGFFGISRDVSEKRKIEKELEKHRTDLELMVQERTTALEQAQEKLIKREKLSVLGQLTATVSHELRNPLGVIRSSNFYLQRKIEKKDDKVIKHLKRIDDQVTMCDDIVADLLEYTRGRNVSTKTAPLHPWLKALVQEIEETQSIPIKLNLSDDLPTVPHDQEKMRRVFINLIENAIHATGDLAKLKKKIGHDYLSEISINLHSEANQLIIMITDNGTGMDSKTLSKAFEPLFTTRARGTGIGLANVQRIINDHGGNITLKSKPDHGTSAFISLPL